LNRRPFPSEAFATPIVNRQQSIAMSLVVFMS
jgi:hypothetical protein